MPSGGGYPIVLTADGTLTGGQRLLFDGMLAASQTTTAPWLPLRWLLLPAASGVAGRAARAPLGLRRVEAALLRAGFGADEVAVVEAAQLSGAIGSRTRVLGISSGEPAGRGMNSSTMTALAGGRIYPERLFRRLVGMARRRLERAAPGARVVLGGPGAWQVAESVELRRECGLDHILTGYCEDNVAELFRELCAGRELPAVLAGEGPGAEGIPPIRNPSAMGAVELSRGCGLGCRFCTLAREPQRHLPEETILADAQTNLAAGVRDLALLSEDFFRYGGAGQRVAPERLLGLLEKLRALPGLRLLQTDHANLGSLAHFRDAELRRARELLAGGSGCEYPWVNVGVETASGSLLRAAGGGAKMAGASDGEWAGFCRRQLERLCQAGFFPFVSLILGLPGEGAEELRLTADWIESLRGRRLAIFPMFYAPPDPMTAQPVPVAAHWRLLKQAYAFNFTWIPRLYWDNQRAAGVGLPRRVLLQMLGRGQSWLWRTRLAWEAR